MERVRKSLVTNEPDIPYFQLRLDAMNAMEEANYHLAVINSITALESLIKFYLSSTLTKPGVKDEALRLRLHDQVTVILRIIFNSVEYDGLINGITNAIRLRNKVIHEAQLNVSKEQANGCRRILSFHIV